MPLSSTSIYSYTDTLFNSTKKRFCFPFSKKITKPPKNPANDSDSANATLSQ